MAKKKAERGAQETPPPIPESGSTEESEGTQPKPGVLQRFHRRFVDPARQWVGESLISMAQPFKPRRLGRVLLREKLITKPQLKRVLEHQKETGLTIGRAVVALGYATESEVLAVLSRHYGVTAESLEDDLAGMIRNRIVMDWTMLRRSAVFKFKLAVFSMVMMGFTSIVIGALMLGREADRLQNEVMRESALRLEMAAFLGRELLTPKEEPAPPEPVRNAKTSPGAKTKSKSKKDPPPPPEKKPPPPRRKEALKITQFFVGAVQKNVVYSQVIDPTGLVLAHSVPAAVGKQSKLPEPLGLIKPQGEVSYFRYVEPKRGETLFLTRPIKSGDELLGHAQMSVSLQDVVRTLWQDAAVGALVGLLVLAFLLTLLLQMGGIILDPPSTLLVTPQEVGQGSRRFLLSLRRNHEFEDMARSFSTLSGELRQKLLMEQSFGRYVAPEVMDMIMKSSESGWLKGSRNEATVLFSDVRGFTKMSEEREPEEVVEALNEYFAIASEAIQSEGGYVDKFIGDAVLGVFGVPETDPEHAARAVRAASFMQKKLQSKMRLRKNFLLSRVGIGINSGPLVSGTVGSKAKMEYTVIGDTVNVASR
ncbi:MAG: hypothetical protein OEW39_06955, partial [Deltaproteobacteria bacterium]|nr:hypothetical protein [Deltaproteobacteria bacterium]